MSGDRVRRLLKERILERSFGVDRESLIARGKGAGKDACAPKRCAPECLRPESLIIRRRRFLPASENASYNRFNDHSSRTENGTARS